MAIRVVCPHCDAAFNVADELRGKKVRCRECEKPVPVVAAKPKKVEDDEDEREERVQAKPRKSAAAPTRRRGDDADDERPARARGKQRYVEDDDDDDDRSVARKGKKKSSATPMIIAAVGGGVVLLAGVIVLIVWLTSEKKPDNATANAGQSKGPPAGMMGGGQGGGPPAGMMGGGMMGKGGPALPPIVIPDEHAGGGAIVLDPTREKDIPLDKEVLSKIKKATAMIIIKEKGRPIASGSGFLAYEPGIVLTNAHVVDMMDPGSEKPEEVEVVFNSTETDEKRVKATVLAADRIADLAVLRVPPEGLPTPLEVKSATSLSETEIVYFCGFPKPDLLGDTLKINGAQVTGIDKDPRTHLPKRLTLKGDMLPGNSGGPVVDAKGNVCGVSVAILVGTRVNFAVPGDHVNTIVHGRLARTHVGQCFHSLNHVNLPLAFDLLNPLDRIQTVEVEVWLGDDDPKYLPLPSVGKPPTPRPNDSRHTRFPLDVQGDRASGFIVLPDPAPGKGKAYWWQPVVTYRDKTGNGMLQHWGSGEKYVLDEPVHRRGVKLLHKEAKGNRNVSLHIKEKFSVLAGKAEESLVTVQFDGELTEQPSPRDAKGKSLLRVAVHKLEKDVKVPDELVPDKKEKEKIDKDMQRALDGVGHNDLTMLINERGDVETSIAVAKTAPDDVRMEIESLGDDILQWLQSVSVPLPNRQMSHMETWTAKRPFAVLTPVTDLHFKAIDMTYTYLGIRTRNGREEALVDMSGKLRNKQFGLHFGCQLDGRALVDLDTGLVSMARANVIMNLDLPIGRMKLTARGTMEVVIERSLPQ